MLVSGVRYSGSRIPNKEFSSRLSEGFRLERLKDWSAILEYDFGKYRERKNA